MEVKGQGATKMLNEMNNSKVRISLMLGLHLPLPIFFQGNYKHIAMIRISKSNVLLGGHLAD